MVSKYKKTGWFNESVRHGLARRGIRTGTKSLGKINFAEAIGKIQKITTTRYKGGDFDFGFEPIEDSIIVTQTKDGGYEVKYLVRDEDAESPDKWGDNSLFLVHYHRDFDVRNDKIITEDDARRWYQGEKIEQEKNYWIIPVEAYIHSGVHLTVDTHKGLLPQGHYEFDTSHVGLALASKKEFKSKQQAEKSMRGLIETWNQYLIGDVYGTVVAKYDKDKKLVDSDEVWGYYGYQDAMQELKSLHYEEKPIAGQKKVTDFAMRKFLIKYTAFKGTKYQQESADKPIIKARDVKSAVNKFNKMPYHNKSSIREITEI